MFLDEDSAVKKSKGPVTPKDLTAVLIDCSPMMFHANPLNYVQLHMLSVLLCICYSLGVHSHIDMTLVRDKRQV